MKNYEFDFNFGGAWGNCAVTVTSVIGHLTGLDFDRQYKGWQSCPPGSLFEAPVQETVDKVRIHHKRSCFNAHVFTRTSWRLRRIFGNKPSMPKHCSSGPIVIAKVSILVLRSVTKRKPEMVGSRSSEPSLATQNARELRQFVGQCLILTNFLAVTSVRLLWNQSIWTSIKPMR